MDAYLRKAGLTRGNIYVILIALAGGGYEHSSKGDELAAMQAQLAAVDTSVALCQQSETFMEKRFDELDKDLKALTQAVDRIPQARIAAN